MTVRGKSKTQENQEIINDYMEVTGSDVLDMRLVAAWAIRNGRWDTPPRDKIKQCAQELSRAARVDFYEDPQGRIVRRKHAYRIKKDDKQLVFWVDIEDAKPGQMLLAFQQRRKGILQDCAQLKIDVDSYNDNNKSNDHIQLTFNFEEDLVELAQPTEYPAEPVEEEELE
jgi:hypothetical protein